MCVYIGLRIRRIIRIIKNNLLEFASKPDVFEMELHKIYQVSYSYWCYVYYSSFLRYHRTRV